jgi:hypothetical protein
MFWKIKRTVFLDKDRTMDNTQKHNIWSRFIVSGTGRTHDVRQHGPVFARRAGKLSPGNLVRPPRALSCYGPAFWGRLVWSTNHRLCKSVSCRFSCSLNKFSCSNLHGISALDDTELLQVTKAGGTWVLSLLVRSLSVSMRAAVSWNIPANLR